MASDYYALEYDTVEGFAERRATFRKEHLRLVHDAHSRGELLMAGALGNPPDGALLIFQINTAARAEEFARGDPYVTGGLVRRWHVRPWAVVVGPDA